MKKTITQWIIQRSLFILKKGRFITLFVIYYILKLQYQAGYIQDF